MLDNNNQRGSFQKIVSIEELDPFDNEFVYDIEVDHDSHSFFANGILVHNSNYVSYEEVIQSCDWEGSGKELILEIYKHRLAEFLDQKFIEYAEERDTENLQNFELELIAKNAIWLAKKKYVMNPVWKATTIEKQEDGNWLIEGIDIKDLSKIKSKGVEIIQSSTPKFARERLKECLRYIFENSKKFDIHSFVKILREYKEEFKLADIQDISFGSRLNYYHKYIINDSTKFEIAPKCPPQSRAAGYYNYLLNNSEYKSKYNLIREGEKIKFYYTKYREEGLKDIFGYLPNQLPYEIAPTVDIDKQFEKCIIKPINRFVTVMGYSEIASSLLVVKSLF